jgi:hypothetical protein
MRQGLGPGHLLTEQAVEACQRVYQVLGFRSEPLGLKRLGLGLGFRSGGLNLLIEQAVEAHGHVHWCTR